MPSRLNPGSALKLLDDLTSRIQLVVNHEGQSVGLTRREHSTVVEALRTLQGALSQPAEPPTP